MASTGESAAPVTGETVDKCSCRVSYIGARSLDGVPMYPCRVCCADPEAKGARMESARLIRDSERAATGLLTQAGALHG